MLRSWELFWLLSILRLLDIGVFLFCVTLLCHVKFFPLLWLFLGMDKMHEGLSGHGVQDITCLLLKELLY